MAITGDLSAPAGDVTLRITNTGSADHNVGVRELGLISPNVGPGGVVELPLGELAPGVYELYCDIAGHEDAGMVNTLTITGEGTGEATGEGGTAGDSGVFRVGDNPIPYGQTFSGVTIPPDLELALDIPMVLNDAGTIGLSLNGKSFPATEPLVVDQGDWVSITYYNEGLQIHPMHLHHFPQLVYAKDGVPLDHPYWVDTLNVAPGERYTVLFRADDVGTWVWHCHILTHVEREDGMFGMVTAIVVNENTSFDPEQWPIDPSNWRNVATTDGPTSFDGGEVAAATHSHETESGDNRINPEAGHQSE